MSQIESIKLYFTPRTRSMRAKSILHEVFGDDFEVQYIDLKQGEHHSPEFVALNPNRSVPVMEIRLKNGESKVMFESGAIVSLLANLYPEKQLAPDPQTQPLARADYEQMLFFTASTMDAILWQMLEQHMMLPEDQKHPLTFERCQKKFKQTIEPQIIERLSKHDYICGDKFTAVDCLMWMNIGWAKMFELCQDPIFDQYSKRMMQRPSFQATVA